MKESAPIAQTSDWTLRSRLRATAWPARLLPLFLVLIRPATVTAQYDYASDGLTATITKYTGAGGAVDVPSTLDGLRVTGIGDRAFADSALLTSVTIPDSVSNLGAYVFYYCTGLTNVVVPASVTNAGAGVFANCSSLGRVALPNSVANLGDGAFVNCASLSSITFPSSLTRLGGNTFGNCLSLTQVTIPNSVTNLGDNVFQYCSHLLTVTMGRAVTSLGADSFSGCYNLQSLYFQGNAPSLGSSAFAGDHLATAYYWPGTTGWGPTFGGLPAVLWGLRVQTGNGTFGVRTNQFGFNSVWADGQVIVVEACTNLFKPVWVPLRTNTFVGDTDYFSDPQWTNFPVRFYRVRSPLSGWRGL